MGYAKIATGLLSAELHNTPNDVKQALRALCPETAAGQEIVEKFRDGQKEEEEEEANEDEMKREQEGERERERERERRRLKRYTLYIYVGMAVGIPIRLATFS